MSKWAIPYVDQPAEFWLQLAEHFGQHIKEVYFPMPDRLVASGRSHQPARYIKAFLRDTPPLAKSVLVNPIVLPRAIEQIGPIVIDALHYLHEVFGVASVVVASATLARLIKERLPTFHISASTLMGIRTAAQVLMVKDYVDAIVPDGSLVRDWRGLKRLRETYAGEIRLMVNEACLPGCVYRTQHFFEMAYNDTFPASLCQQLLEEQPWLRLTGAWILPRHLHHYAGLYDTLKLAGRVTLQEPETYFKVFRAYVDCEPILPSEIGGGPASLLGVADMPDDLFQSILRCDKRCESCSICRRYYESVEKDLFDGDSA